MSRLTCWINGHETYVERNARGILELHCHACGYVTEAIQRSAKERQVMRRKFRRIETPTATAAAPARIAKFK